jgi:elongation factor Ts
VVAKTKSVQLLVVVQQLTSLLAFSNNIIYNKNKNYLNKKMSTITISAADVAKLRNQTGAGMMDCRAALQETNGDFEGAIDYLRKKGQKVAAKRSDREAKEGVVIAKTSADGKTGIIINLTSETDFVSKNEDFQKFGLALSDLAVAHNCKTVDELKACSIDGATVADRLLEMVGKIGEKIDVTTVQNVSAESMIAYNHGAYRVAVLIGTNQANSDAIQAAGKDVAMQVAAMNPVAIDADGVSEEMIAREKAIIVDTMKADPKMEGKPEEMIMKIAEGKIGAFFKENTLVAQQFVKDQSKTVGEYIKSVHADLKITNMIREQIG